MAAVRTMPDEAATAGDDLEQRAVDLVDDRAAGLLVEVVDVLRDDRHAHVLLHPRDRRMAGVNRREHRDAKANPTDSRRNMFQELTTGEH